MWIAALTILLAGLLIAGTGIAARAGRLPRNGWVGIRIASTLQSDAAWQAGHRAGAVAMIIGGFAAMACAVVAMWVPSEDAAFGWVLGGAFAMLAFVLVAAVLAHRAATR